MAASSHASSKDREELSILKGGGSPVSPLILLVGHPQRVGTDTPTPILTTVP